MTCKYGSTICEARKGVKNYDFLCVKHFNKRQYDKKRRAGRHLRVLNKVLDFLYGKNR